MTFSIITVTYNATKVIERTLQSVAEQTFKDIEHIVVDGNSNDGTQEIVKHYPVQRFVSEPDSGIYEAMNKGLHIAQGDYVWFLNAGDTLKNKDTVASVAEVCRANAMPDVVYGETDLAEADGTVFAHRRLKAPQRLTWKSFRMGMLVCHQAFIAKRTLAEDYDLRYRLSGDFDWCIRCMRKAATIVNSGLCLVNYLYEGATTANRKASLKERYSIMCKYFGTFATSLLHLWFALRFYSAKWLGRAV